jgi:hypothetical protein
LILPGSNKTIASTACPIFAPIAQARRRIATAASSEKLGLYIFFPLFDIFFEAFGCFPNTIADIALMKIFVVVGYVGQGETVYMVIGYVYIVVVDFFHD